MNKNKMKTKNILIVLACCLLVITAVYQHFSNKQDMLTILQQAEPDAANYKEIEGTYKTYELKNQKGEFLNYAVFTSASGYGGPISILTTINKDGKIDNVIILENGETPSYLARVLESGYPENLKGHSITESFESNEAIDAVSGATRTTEGILGAVEKGVAQVGQNQLGVEVPKVGGYHLQWEDGAIVLLLLLAVIAATRKIKKLRIPLLVASVLIIGFMAKSSLSLGNFMSIIMNKMPIITERPIWFFLVIGILVVTLILGKNIYCGYICPFGAAQEGIYEALNLTKNKLDQRIIAVAGKSRWFFIWLAAMLALYSNNPGIASYEPFSPFFGGKANTAQWIMMGLILVTSIVVFRFWCRCFCPIGTVLDFLAQAKRKIKKIFVKRPAAQLNSAVHNQSGCVSCSTCKSGCGKNEKKATPLSSFNKIIVGLIVVIDLLVITALLQNSGLF
jgi:Na+-translocating ferredoxin:NAD+ oxidoreductase RnfG subunit